MKINVSEVTHVGILPYGLDYLRKAVPTLILKTVCRFRNACAACQKKVYNDLCVTLDSLGESFQYISLSLLSEIVIRRLGYRKVGGEIIDSGILLKSRFSRPQISRTLLKVE